MKSVLPWQKRVGKRFPSWAKASKRHAWEFLKDIESLVDINVKVFTPGPRCSRVLWHLWSLKTRTLWWISEGIWQQGSRPSQQCENLLLSQQDTRREIQRPCHPIILAHSPYQHWRPQGSTCPKLPQGNSLGGPCAGRRMGSDLVQVDFPTKPSSMHWT